MIIAACFPISPACFIAVLARILVVESVVQVAEFFVLRRRHVKLIVQCAQRFCRPGPLACSVAVVIGWMQHGTIGAGFILKPSISAVALLIGLFTDSVHVEARWGLRGRIGYCSVG